jgi:hypothetical protein
VTILSTLSFTHLPSPVLPTFSMTLPVVIYSTFSHSQTTNTIIHAHVYTSL